MVLLHFVDAEAPEPLEDMLSVFKTPYEANREDVDSMLLTVTVWNMESDSELLPTSGIATKMPKRQGSQNYSEGEKQCLLGLVHSHQPSRKAEWQSLAIAYNAAKDPRWISRDFNSLKRKLRSVRIAQEAEKRATQAQPTNTKPTMTATRPSPIRSAKMNLREAEQRQTSSCLATRPPVPSMTYQKDGIRASPPATWSSCYNGLKDGTQEFAGVPRPHLSTGCTHFAKSIKPTAAQPAATTRS
ncbi:hypothetical protein PC113_g16709 [Phytophthora cactorum]|uniref:DUF6818 domain-containing protein n=1 Tax=Phytophthora cactorum TaxID=29920 RepID=A0A8T0YDJ8_9STRA|nr:hypothetical protein PC113_g16709 [Phytophthora cactorum]